LSARWQLQLSEPLSSRKYCPLPIRQNVLKPEGYEITERHMMIAPIFARLSTRRQMLRKGLVLVVSLTLRATPTAIAAGISEMESYTHHTRSVRATVDRMTGDQTRRLLRTAPLTSSRHPTAVGPTERQLGFSYEAEVGR
jgi:hypothetical protein